MNDYMDEDGKMETQITVVGDIIATGSFRVQIFKENLDKGVYQASRKAFKAIKNNAFRSETEFFETVYPEIDWATFFTILEKYPDKEEMILYVYPVKIKNMPTLYKKNYEYGGNLTFTIGYRDEDDLMVVGQGIMNDMDAWIDAFIGTRVYDPINSEWENTKDASNG